MGCRYHFFITRSEGLTLFQIVHSNSNILRVSNIEMHSPSSARWSSINRFLQLKLFPWYIYTKIISCNHVLTRVISSKIWYTRFHFTFYDANFLSNRSLFFIIVQYDGRWYQQGQLNGSRASYRELTIY